MASPASAPGPDAGVGGAVAAPAVSAPAAPAVARGAGGGHPGAACACCGRSFSGPDGPRPRHECGFCDQAVCASCSPSRVQPSGRTQPLRACARCTAPILQAPAAALRLVQVEQRLRSADEQGRPRAPSEPVPGRGDRSIEEAVEMVEMAVHVAEESRAAAARRADEAESAARAECARRAALQARAGQLKESVEGVGEMIKSACQACDSCARPFEDLVEEHAADAEAERWAARLGADRAAMLRQVRAASAEAQAARAGLFRLAFQLNGLRHHSSGEPLCQRPLATDSAEDLAALCERAVPEIRQALLDAERRASDNRSRPHSRSPSRDTKTSKSSSGTRRSIQTSFSSYTADATCVLCGVLMGKRRFNSRRHCDMCRENVCGRCSVFARLCLPCHGSMAQQQAAILEGAAAEDPSIARLARVGEALRAIAGPAASGAVARKQPGVPMTKVVCLETIAAQYESLLPHLKDLRTGHDLARVLAEDIREQFERNARLMASLQSVWGPRLEALTDAGGSVEP